MAGDKIDTEKDASTTTDNLEPLSPVETNNVRPACFSSTFQEVLFVLTATMAIAMNSILAGAVTVTSAYIGRDLDMTTAQITWITAAASLSGGAFLLFFGRMADLFGRKSLFVGSLFLFAVFALAAGFSQNAITIDVLSGVLGLISSSGVPSAVGILGAIYEKPSKRKNAAFACFSAGNPLGFVFGTIFGGLAANIFSWRASYYLIAIIFLVFTIIGIWTIPRDTAAKEPFNLATIKKFDLVGVFCVIFGIGMFSAALSLGDTAPQGWRTGYVLALLIVGVLLMIAFVFWDYHFAHPLVPMHIWKDRNFSLSLAILLLGFMSFVPANFFLALYFQDVWGMSPLDVAVHLLVMVVVGLATNVVAGLVLHRVSNKLIMGVGAGAYVLSFLLLVFNRSDRSYWSFCFPSLVFLVIGADLEFNVANMYVMSSMPQSQQSVAGGMFQTVTRLSQTIGFGVATAVFNSVQAAPTLSPYWDRPSQPYAAVYFISLAASTVALGLVPFLTLRTQGGKDKGQTAGDGETKMDAEEPNK